MLHDLNSADVECGLNSEDAVVLKLAHEIFGADAVTAIAFFGIDAWFEGRDEDVARCARLVKDCAN